MPAAESKNNENITQAMEQLTRMMDQGRSFSSHEKNCSFLNTGGERFATVSAVSGFDFPDDARALAVVDWDQDGYPDLWVSNRNGPRLRFLHNDYPHTHHFLALKLQGNGTTTNRDAIGSRVEIVAKGLQGKRLIRSLRAGEGFLAQSSKVLTIGLGKLDAIDKIKVRWPGGAEEEFAAIKVDSRYLLVQGSGKADPLTAPKRTLVIAPAEQEPIKYAGIKVPLTVHLPMPKSFTYPDFAGVVKPLPVGNGKPLLLVTWASWCEPCQKELADLAAREKDLRAAGIELLALSADGLGEDQSTPAAAAAFLKAKNFPFPSGRATPELAQLLTGLHHQLVCLTRPLPIPASFLFDGQGRLTTIYKGRAAVDEILAEAKRSPKTLRERWETAACLPGRMIDHDGLYESLRVKEFSVYASIAITFAGAGRFADALDYYRAALDVQPDFVDLRQGYGVALERLGRRDEALKEYLQVLKKYPDRAVVHLQIGNLHAAEKRHAEAVPYLRKAVQLDPKLTAAQESLARVETAIRGGGR